MSASRPGKESALGDVSPPDGDDASTTVDGSSPTEHPAVAIKRPMRTAINRVRIRSGYVSCSTRAGTARTPPGVAHRARKRQWPPPLSRRDHREAASARMTNGAGLHLGVPLTRTPHRRGGRARTPQTSEKGHVPYREGRHHDRRHTLRRTVRSRQRSRPDPKAGSRLHPQRQTLSRRSERRQPKGSANETLAVDAPSSFRRDANAEDSSQALLRAQSFNES